MSDGVMASLIVVCPVLAVLLVALIVVLAVVGAKKEKERRAGLAAWAHAHGWRYQDRPGVAWLRRMPGAQRQNVPFALFGTLRGVPVTVAEYTYVTTSTTTNSNGSTSTSTTTHRHVVAVAVLPQSGPAVAVVPRHVFSKLGRSMFGDAKTATGNERFDSGFKISADDPRWAHRLVGPALMAAHLAEQVPPWSVSGNELISIWSGRTLRDPATVPSYAESVLRVADLLGR